MVRPALLPLVISPSSLFIIVMSFFVLYMFMNYRLFPSILHGYINIHVKFGVESNSIFKIVPGQNGNR